MKNHYRIVDRYQAEKILRFVNAIVDYAVTYIIIVFLFMVILLVYSVLTGMSYEINAQRLENINPLLDRIVTAIFYVLLFTT